MDPSDTASPKGVTPEPSGSSLNPVSPPMERNNSNPWKPGHLHRQSFAENQRYPPSPRSQRHQSFTQAALHELMNNSPSNRHPSARYAGIDWRSIPVGELAEDVTWADFDFSVQETTMLLIKSSTNLVLVRENSTSKTAVTTFEYSDLNAYLLTVVGLAKPEPEQVQIYSDIAKKAQSQQDVSLREIQSLAKKGDLVMLPADATLDKAVEAFGSGVHRLLVTNPAGEVVGVLSQLRLVGFFWNEAANFPVIDRLYGCLLRDLQIGSHQIIAINLDRPLSEALLLFHSEGLTSVAVVDSNLNVVGNISTADIKHLTTSTRLPLLKNSCMNFISVVLSERGMEHGRDSFPVYHVNPYSTLGHTIAKLTATKSHRMWITESASPSPSAPATPLLSATHVGSLGSPPPGNIIIPPPGNASAPQSPLPNQTFSTTVIPSGVPGARLSGRLTGVVSMTDILNLFAKSSGLRASDPTEQRSRRRRSSSASVRPSIEGARPSVDFGSRR